MEVGQNSASIRDGGKSIGAAGWAVPTVGTTAPGGIVKIPRRVLAGQLGVSRQPPGSRFHNLHTWLAFATFSCKAAGME